MKLNITSSEPSWMPVAIKIIYYYELFIIIINVYNDRLIVIINNT